MGHGVPASLLTIFVKTAVKSKEIRDGNYRLVPPSEVLERLNAELLAQELPDRPFVTMVYALYNFREGTFRFARSGHPYPLYIPREGRG
jgi:serine phosphatase RsbU (regulator of sigma subunit)